MAKYTIFDRAQGGLVEADNALVAVTTFLRQNLDGSIMSTTDATDPLILGYDPAQGKRVPQRQSTVPSVFEFSI